MAVNGEKQMAVDTEADELERGGRNLDRGDFVDLYRAKRPRVSRIDSRSTFHAIIGRASPLFCSRAARRAGHRGNGGAYAPGRSPRDCAATLAALYSNAIPQ